MRLMAVLALSVAVFAVPALAQSGPAQSTTTTNVEPAPASTAAQVSAAPPAVGPSQAAAAPAMQTGPEHVVVQANADTVNLDQVVCKSEPPAIGSRLGGGRECHTEREWKQRMHESQDITRHQQIVGWHQ